MSPSELKQLLNKTIPRKKPILLYGAPGIGKTAVVEQVCSDIRMSAVDGDRKRWRIDKKGQPIQLITMHPVISDPTDFKGFPFAFDGQADFLPFGDLKRIMEADCPTVVFLDDLGQSPVSVQAACMQLLLARRINGHAVSPLVCFMAATNRKEDRAGVTGVLEPVKSRFLTLIELYVNHDDWCEWANRNELSPDVVGFIRARPPLLFDFKPSADMTNSPCPRTVASVSDIVMMGLPDAIEYEAIAGACGKAFALEYRAWKVTLRSLPDIRKLLDKPDPNLIPKHGEIDKLWAVVSGISAIAQLNDVPNVMTLLKMIPPEFGTFMVKSLTHRNPDTLDHAAMAQWLADNSHLGSDD